jgi:hypothetical protein
MYSLSNEKMNKYLDVKIKRLWPIHVQNHKGKTIFYFKDKADYLLQRKNDVLVRGGIQLQGIDY